MISESLAPDRLLSMSELFALIVDCTLLLALIVTAIGVLITRKLYTAVVLFIVFGVLMTLAWVRLQAPDLALAEAAIGAGLTGVLLLDALGHLKPDGSASDGPESIHTPEPDTLLAGLGLMLAAGLTGVLWWVLINPGDPVVHLDQAVQQHLPATGVESPVTAVLLAFRAYDTLLEVAVILVAAVTGLALRFSQEDQPAQHLTASTGSHIVSPLLRYMMAWLLPLMVMVATYLIWMGSVRHGGAFQAAAVLAAMAVLMRMTGVAIPGHERLWLLRLGLVGGLSVFLLAGALAMISGGAFLAWPQAWAGVLILVVEIALTFSLGWLLFSLFETSPAPQQQQLFRGDR